MLLASHIKPWRNSNDHDRLDPRNGIAACPIHDSAFDAGLLTVCQDLRIQRHPRLAVSIELDPGSAHYFAGSGIRDRLHVPEGQSGPGRRFLDWHRQVVFGAGLEVLR